MKRTTLLKGPKVLSFFPPAGVWSRSASFSTWFAPENAGTLNGCQLMGCSTTFPSNSFIVPCSCSERLASALEISYVPMSVCRAAASWSFLPLWPPSSKVKPPLSLAMLGGFSRCKGKHLPPVFWAFLLGPCDSRVWCCSADREKGREFQGVPENQSCFCAELLYLFA